MGWGFTGPQGIGIGRKYFFHHTRWDENETRQYHGSPGRKLHPSSLSWPIAIPKLTVPGDVWVWLIADRALRKKQEAKKRHNHRDKTKTHEFHCNIVRQTPNFSAIIMARNRNTRTKTTFFFILFTITVFCYFIPVLGFGSSPSLPSHSHHDHSHHNQVSVFPFYLFGLYNLSL